MIEASQTAQMAQISRTALNYCRLGASDAQLAEFFGVSPETVGGWLADSPEFAAAVRRGRKMADAEMVDSLHRLGMGYVETVEKVMICRGEPMVVTYQKQHRPHYKAGVMWLCNRMPEQWSWPGARRQQAAVAPESVDFFTLPLLVDEEDEAVGHRHPERSRPEDGAVEGPPLADAATAQVSPLRLVEPAPSEVEGLASGRDDGGLTSEEIDEWTFGVPPPPQPVLAAA